MTNFRDLTLAALLQNLVPNKNDTATVYEVFPLLYIFELPIKLVYSIETSVQNTSKGRDAVLKVTRPSSQ